MGTEKTKATGYRLPETLYWEFKQKAVERHVHETEALRLAIREWIDKEASALARDQPGDTPSHPPRENPVAPTNKSEYAGKDPEIQKWVGKLVQVLESRHSAAIRAVLSSL